MEADVNARLHKQKRDRLARLFEAGFDEWFLENFETVTPTQVWQHLADGLNADMGAKTLVLSMKIWEISRLIRTGEYLDFPSDIPIPCDL
jgi:N-glycosylase/DNA lyase